MRHATLGTLLVVGFLSVAIGAFGQQGENFSQGLLAAPPATASSELVVLPTILGDKTQVLTVVDPRQRVLSIYHVDLATGKITLKSVRNIQWDLQIMQLNNEAPLPQEIRSMSQQR